RLEEPAAERLGIDHEALGNALRAREGGPKIAVAAAVGREHRAFVLLRSLVVGRAAPQAVDDGGIATGLEFALQASNRAHRTVAQSRQGPGRGPARPARGSPPVASARTPARPRRYRRRGKEFTTATGGVRNCGETFCRSCAHAWGFTWYNRTRQGSRP